MKEEQYKLLVSQIASLIDGEGDMIAVMSNVAAAIHQTMGFWWTGFYRVIGDELVLGPFQERAETVIVPDVEQFPGHIACSSESRSEIVVPVFGNDGKVMAVLDIDSERLATFDDTDRKYLEEICQRIRLSIR